MTENRFNFTNKTILNLSFFSAERSNATYYYDTKVRGLGIYVTRKGIKTFFVYRRVEGKPERIILGRTDEITLERAREKAANVNSQIAEGINPQEKKRAIRQEITLGELWEVYLERHAKHYRISSCRNDKSLYQLYLSQWSNKKLTLISTQNIRDLHQRIGREKGTVRANHAHALLRLMFNKAIEWGWNKPNPTYAVKRFKEISRERFLSTSEMKTFLTVLEQEPHELVRDYLYMSLFTGARRSNVQAMRWKDIDLEAAQWLIPLTKNGKPHTVPLVEALMDILKRRKQSANSQWVFPSAKSKSGHLENPVPIWNGVLERAGISDLRIHDLRRTLGSWQAALGANCYVIGKSLGHSSQQATAIYARIDLNPVRQSVNGAVQAMLCPQTPKNG